MKLRKIKENEAGLGLMLSIILFVVALVLIASVISIVWGLLSFIGLMLLCGAAFILFMKKGAVTFTPNSPFMWLLIIGLLCVGFSQATGLEFGSFDLSNIPGLADFHNFFGF